MRVWQKLWAVAAIVSVLFVLFALQCAAAENGQIHGMVWLEKNSDGLYNSGENGLEFAKITLERLDENGVPQVAINTTSDRTGAYLFYSVPADTYRIRAEVNSEYRFTLHGLGSASLDGNILILEGQTSVVMR